LSLPLVALSARGALSDLSGYGARGPKKTDDWQQFFKDKEPDFSEEGWARRKPKKK